MWPEFRIECSHSHSLTRCRVTVIACSVSNAIKNVDSKNGYMLTENMSWFLVNNINILYVQPATVKIRRYFSPKAVYMEARYCVAHKSILFTRQQH